MANIGKRLLQNPIVEGALVGLAASQALDQLSIFMYENESLETRRQEDKVRNGRHAYEVAVANAAKLFGKTLTREQEQKFGWRFHQAFGLISGYAYAAARKRNEKLGLGRGLLFGTLFFLVVDELMMPLFRFTPGPLKFNWKVHARGAASHIAYGVAAESAYRAIQAAT